MAPAVHTLWKPSTGIIMQALLWNQHGKPKGEGGGGGGESGQGIADDAL